jgi:hypothetical protein
VWGPIVRGRRVIAALAFAVPMLAGCTAGPTDSGSAAPQESTAPADPGAAAAETVHFTAVGDMGASDNVFKNLDLISQLQPDFHIALGDMNYNPDRTEEEWCQLVTDRVGVGFPFELIAGNHESNGRDGDIDAFSACLPNQLPGAIGTYGRQWYVDFPAEKPLVRMILISPNLEFPDGQWQYDRGGSRYEWTKTAIQGARAENIPWVVAGMHYPCLTLGVYACAAGSDITNLLLEEKVDLVLNGHEHAYSRTNQLGLSGSCSSLAIESFDPACVTNEASDVKSGQGTVIATVGTGGTGIRDLNLSDPELPYFAVWSGANVNQTWGLLDMKVTRDRLDAKFVPVTGTFTDEFSITK